MTLTRSRIITACAALAITSAGLLWAGLLLPLLTAAALGAATWLLVTAWGVDPVPGTTPSRAVGPQPTPRPDEKALLRSAFLDARRLPQHALANPAAVEELWSQLSRNSSGDASHVADAALEAVGL